MVCVEGSWGLEASVGCHGDLRVTEAFSTVEEKPKEGLVVFVDEVLCPSGSALSRGRLAVSHGGASLPRSGSPWCS
jgi:hypothetical protein